MAARFTVVAAAPAIWLGLLLSSAACVQQDSSLTGLTSPSPTASSSGALTLTVRVHVRGSESPISGALVRHEAAGYYTNASGESLISVGSGSETTIDVSASGYHAMQASGVLNGDERWTFYLEPQPK